MNLSKAHVNLLGCVHEFIYHWNCLSVIHSSIFRTANFYWRHLRLLCLPVLFGHLEMFSKRSKSLNLKTCLIRTTSASDRNVLVCVSAWFICISPLTNYNVCRRNIKQTHSSLCFTINWLDFRWNTRRSFTLFCQSYDFYRRHLDKLIS